MIYAEIFMKLLPRMPLEKKRILNESRKWNNYNQNNGRRKTREGESEENKSTDSRQMPNK